MRHVSHFDWRQTLGAQKGHVRHVSRRGVISRRLLAAAVAACGPLVAIACGGTPPGSSGVDTNVNGSTPNDYPSPLHPVGRDAAVVLDTEGGVETTPLGLDVDAQQSPEGGVETMPLGLDVDAQQSPEGGVETMPSAPDVDTQHGLPMDAGGALGAQHGVPVDAGRATLAPESGATDASSHADGGYPSGWLYTSGAKIYESNGAGSGTQWMGRGVNVDDIFLCGYNNTLWMTSPVTTVEQEISTLMTGWKPTFLRISLGMDSSTVVSWVSNPSVYRTPMTAVINAIGSYPGVHVLVTLRSDVTMIGQDTSSNDGEATGIPSDSKTTPNASLYPTGTDAVYVALVDTFATSSFVMFGLTNEPGGNTASNATLAAAMNHAVGTIRAEEDRLGVPHHIVSVQGNNWTSSIAFYSETADGGQPDGGSGLITYDNVVYEVHGYPPAASSYTFPNIPVILGEYGSLPANSSGADPSFYADLEAKQIPNLAWDFESYSDCAPDLVNVNQSSTSITPTSPWGTMVQSYLLSHAP